MNRDLVGRFIEETNTLCSSSVQKHAHEAHMEAEQPSGRCPGVTLPDAAARLHYSTLLMGWDAQMPFRFAPPGLRLVLSGLFLEGVKSSTYTSGANWCTCSWNPEISSIDNSVLNVMLRRHCQIAAAPG